MIRLGWGKEWGQGVNHFRYPIIVYKYKVIVYKYKVGCSKRKMHNGREFRGKLNKNALETD